MYKSIIRIMILGFALAACGTIEHRYPEPMPQPDEPICPKDCEDKEQEGELPIGDDNTHASVILDLLEEINEARARQGLHAFKFDSKLNCAAEIHAKDIGSKQICGHTGSNGSSVGDRLAMCGFNGWQWAENVACGQRTPSEAVQAWHKSAGHAHNMYNPEYTHVGLAMVNNYWVNVFR